MANPNIPLSVGTLDTATPIRQMGEDQDAHAANAEKILQAHYQTMNDREKARLSSVISGAVHLKSFLDNGDVQGANNFLMQRKQQLMTRMAHGENVDTAETDAAIQMLRSGKIDELKQNIEGLTAAGRVYGILDNKDLPSDIQSALYYQGSDQKFRDAYAVTRRAPTVVNLGGTQEFIPAGAAPTGGSSPAQTSSMTVTPKPEEMPDFKRQQEAAKLQGSGTIPETAKYEKGRQNLTTVINAARNSYTELDKLGAITNPDKSIVDNIAAYAQTSAAGQLAGKASGTKAQAIINQLSTMKPALINAIRQATGMSAKAMDTNTELQFYLQQATDPHSLDIKANLFALNMLDQLYGVGSVDIGNMDNAYQGKATSGQATGGQATGGQTVRVVNPKTGEDLTIPASDLAAAQAEGFVQQ